MKWQYTPYTPLLAITVAISLILAVYMWRRRQASFAMPATLLMLLVAQWSVGYILELSAPALAEKIFWSQTQYIGIGYLPLAWLATALYYTSDTRWVKGWRLALLLMVPTITVILVFTNGYHHLLWSSVTLESVRFLGSNFNVLLFDFGSWFWINAVYLYLVLLVGTIAFLRTIVRSRTLFQNQIVVLVIGIAFPWFSNFLYLTGLSPFPGLDLTPVAFALTGIALAIGLFRYRLMEIVPVAHDTLFASMAYGVLVLDALHRILDMNPAAEIILDRRAQSVVGRALAQAFPDYADFVAYCTLSERVDTEITLSQATSVHLESIYNLQVSSLGRGTQTPNSGWLVILADITERKLAEERIRESEERFRILFQESQATLAETAALYETSRILIASEDLPSVLQGLVDSTVHALPADRVSVITVDMNERVVRGRPPKM